MISSFFRFSLILSFILLLVSVDQNTGSERKEDKLVLSPIELIDLVLKERTKKNLGETRSYHKSKKYINSLLKEEEEITTGTKEPIKELQMKTTTKSISSSNSLEENSHTNAFLERDTASRQSLSEDNHGSHRVILKEPYSITKLAKTPTFGFDPYFSKIYFEPFERRPKPVTLVAFRKNGLMPRKSIKVNAAKSSEVAELQSPYNEVSSFWQNEPGESL